ncbi:MAG: GTPase ObgE, partial [Spirochaetaceae bacterium]|nr:GTPase ObgE [Spirochaetaceae bacterium]
MNRFADEAVIEVSSGKGGNGCIAFRREKFVPKGGPAGGDGGKGGDVIFTVRRNLRTLYHLRYKRTFKAENGHDGEGRGRFGRAGGDVIIPVPPGSVLFDGETDERIRDFAKDTGDFCLLRGGNGGWGNIHFKSATNQAPRIAYGGQDGGRRIVRVELQIIADIGFAGFPNAGKSSLLNAYTNARPKIAPYPFTTKVPNLGVLNLDAWGLDDDGSFPVLVLADIPGLIEGASEGAGLGFQFLKHINRTSGLAFIIDLSDDNYLTAFDALSAELRKYDPTLLSKKRVIVGTKLDLDGTAEHLEELRARFPEEKVFGISVFSRTGLAGLA